MSFVQDFEILVEDQDGSREASDCCCNDDKTDCTLTDNMKNLSWIKRMTVYIFPMWDIATKIFGIISSTSSSLVADHCTADNTD